MLNDDPEHGVTVPRLASLAAAQSLIDRVFQYFKTSFCQAGAGLSLMG